MLKAEPLKPRVSSYPWSLYQAEHLAHRRPSSGEDGFYTGMLKDDLQKQRYAYEISMVPVGAESSRASEVISALLNDFNHTGYGRDPAAIICEFVDGLLEESESGQGLVLELYALADEVNRTKSTRFATPGSSEGKSEHLPALGLIPNWSVERNRSDLTQVSAHAGQPPVPIPVSRVHRLRLRPSNLNRWTQVVRGLRQIDASHTVGAELDRLSWRGYSFTEMIETQNLAVAGTAAPIGWDGRGTFSGLVTSPYMVFRRLRFARFWIEAVEDSISFLNHFTSSEMLYGRDAFTFSLTGLPTPAELTAAMRDIQSGSLTIELAHSRYLFPKRAS